MTLQYISNIFGIYYILNTYSTAAAGETYAGIRLLHDKYVEFHDLNNYRVDRYLACLQVNPYYYVSNELEIYSSLLIYELPLSMINTSPMSYFWNAFAHKH